jgi:hypothetical protein
MPFFLSQRPTLSTWLLVQERIPVPDQDQSPDESMKLVIHNATSALGHEAEENCDTRLAGEDGGLANTFASPGVFCSLKYM